MSLSAVDEEVLWACGDDYEAPHTIVAHVARELEREVTESEVRASLLALADEGYVQAYLFDDRLKQWDAVPAELAKRHPEAWFRITAKGSGLFDDEE